MTNPHVTIRGTLARVTHTRGGCWFAGVVERDGEAPVNVAGVVSPIPRPGSRVTLECTIEKTEWGDRYRIARAEVEPPGDVEGAVLAILSLPWIGVAKARDLAAKLGPDPLSRIANDPTALDGVKGLGKAKADRIREVVKAEFGTRSTDERLYALGLRDGRIRRCRERFGASLDAILDENPYRLVDVPGVSFRAIDDGVMRGGRFAPHSPFRAAAAVSHCLAVAADEDGHTWLPLEAVGAALDGLRLAYPIPHDAIEEGVAECVRAGTAVRVEGQRGIALPEVASDEERIAAKILAMIAK